MAYKIPELLSSWLEDREFIPERLTDDIIYSAALELQYDIETSEHYDDTDPAKKAAVTRYIKRMSKTCKRVSLSEWY